MQRAWRKVTDQGVSLSQQDKVDSCGARREIAVINHHLQCFVEDGVDCVSLNAGLPFALTRFFGEQITFDITETQKQKDMSNSFSWAFSTAGILLNFLTKCSENMR